MFDNRNNTNSFLCFVWRRGPVCTAFPIRRFQTVIAAAQTGQWRRDTARSATLTSRAVTRGEVYIFDKHLGSVGKLWRVNSAYHSNPNRSHFASFWAAHNNTEEPHSRCFFHREPEFWWNDNKAAGCYKLPQTNGGCSHTGIPRLNNRRNRRHLEADRPARWGSRLYFRTAGGGDAQKSSEKSSDTVWGHRQMRPAFAYRLDAVRG